MAIAAIDGDIRRSANRARIGALVFGVGCLVVTATLVVAIHTLFYWLPVIGIANLGFALLYNPEAEARKRAKRPTNLTGL